MELIDRVRALLPAAVEKRMFGGTGFMVDGALACSVSPRGLLVRVGPDQQAGLLAAEGVEPMVMGGRTSRGWVHVLATRSSTAATPCAVGRARRRGGAGLGQPGAVTKSMSSSTRPSRLGLEVGVGADRPQDPLPRQGEVGLASRAASRGAPRCRASTTCRAG